MSSVLIAFATTHGHTRKVAERIAEVLEREGLTADLREVKAAVELDLRGYDGVIAGGSIHAGHHQRAIVDWAKGHATALSGMPSACSSRSPWAGGGGHGRVAGEATRKYIDDFLDDTGWMPSATESIAGALQYREYDFATRLLMRLLMKRGGHPTDSSHWTTSTPTGRRSTAFAHRCAAMVAGKPL